MVGSQWSVPRANWAVRSGGQWSVVNRSQILLHIATWWFNITVTNLRKLMSQFLSKPFTVQLGTRVLTNFEINLAPSLLNFVRQAVPVTLVFLNYYRPGLLFAYFGDAKTLVWVNP